MMVSEKKTANYSSRSDRQVKTMIVFYAFVVCSICALGFLIFRVQSSRFLRLTDKLPGPGRCAVLGNFLDLMCDDGNWEKRFFLGFFFR